MTTTAAAELAALPATGRDRLYAVPARGLAQRAADRRQEQAHRRTRAYEAYDQDTPQRAAFAVGVDAGLWGMAPATADRLGELAAQLTAHTIRVIGTHRVIVTATLTGHEASVSVLALRGRVRALVHPAHNAAIQALADTCGYTALAAGPCLYACLGTTPGQTIPGTRERHA
ncbi:hypothetical protein ACWC9H_27340 [Streptomyces sp. NPDC001251]